MTISSGVGPHAAWLSVDGAQFPLERGSVSQHGLRESSTFSGAIPMSLSGVRSAMAKLIGGNQAQILVQARGTTAPLVTGEIDDVDFDYIGRTIRFTGRDLSARLHEVKSSESWQNKKPSDIVTDLIGRVGLSGNIAASAIMAGKSLQTDYVALSEFQSYAEVIEYEAQLDGMRWFFDAAGVFHYVPLGSQSGMYSITIDQNSQPIVADCLELHIKHNLQAGKTVQTNVKSWHPKKRKVFEYTSNVAGQGGSKSYSYTSPTLLQDHVTQYARSRAAEIARHEFTVEAEVVGDPSVAAGMGLSVSGTDFDQSFDIDSVHHEFGMSGYTTSIMAKSAKAGRSAS